MNINPVLTDTPTALTLESPTDITAPADPGSEPSPPAVERPGTSRDGRPNGKIARFPKTLRDQINQWLLDGVSYPNIIQRLGEHGKSLKPDSISQWKKRNFKTWLAEQAFIDRIRARQETPGELARDFDATDVNHAALQLGTLHIFEALREKGSGSLNQKLGGDCQAFARLLNALARASRETMQLQKYREACARARAALTELKDPKRKLNESETRAIVRKVDEILGFGPEDEESDLGGDGSSLPDGPATELPQTATAV